MLACSAHEVWPALTSTLPADCFRESQINVYVRSFIAQGYRSYALRALKTQMMTLLAQDALPHNKLVSNVLKTLAHVFDARVDLTACFLWYTLFVTIIY